VLPAERQDCNLLPDSETRRIIPYVSTPTAELGTEQASVPLSQLLWILRRHWWKMLLFISLSVLLTYAVAKRLTPIYEATSTIEIDRQTPPGVIGQEASRAALNDADQFLATQIKVIQADSVLRPVALLYDLFQHERQAGFGDSQTASRFTNAPVLLKQLRITRPPNTYLLQISYRSQDPKLAADVANAISHSYLEQTYNSRMRSSSDLSSFMEKQLDELRAKMERSSAALAQTERDLNVVNPEEKTNMLATRLIQLNNEYTNTQTDRMKKEAAYTSMSGGTLEAAQVSTQGEGLKVLTTHLNEAEEKFAGIKEHYGSNHPEYVKQQAQVTELHRQVEEMRATVLRRAKAEFEEATGRESMLKSAVHQVKADYDRMNARSFEYQSLKREAEADKKLYEELVRRIKEAGINANFVGNAIRITDGARPPAKPVYPDIPLSLLFSFLISTLIASGVAILSDTLDDKVRDPDQINALFHVDVVGTLPVMREWRSKLALPKFTENGERSTTALVKAGTPNYDGYDEAVRILRSSIMLINFDRRIRSLLVTSAVPGEGKTTTAVHLSLSHAKQGRRTLLIDADLRRPNIHKLFAFSKTIGPLTLNTPPSTGLGDVLAGRMSWKDAVVTATGHPWLHVLPAGLPSRSAPDLIGDLLPRILDEAALEYDLIVIDSPPLLGFAEPRQMATAVDGVLVVARAGITERKVVASVLETLRRLRATTVGIVLNQVSAHNGSGYGYYAAYRQYSSSA
jgi:capsular exopolysaccharide synthesis family protein